MKTFNRLTVGQIVRKEAATKLREMNNEYKGYEIQTIISSHCAYVYKGSELLKCIAGDIFADGSHNAISKAKIYIDSLAAI